MRSCMLSLFLAIVAPGLAAIAHSVPASDGPIVANAAAAGRALAKHDANYLSASFQLGRPVMDELAAQTGELSSTDIKARAKRISSLLNRYTRRLQQQPPLCAAPQACVHARYFCPAKLGNGMQELANAFLLALATNATLVWTWQAYGSGLRPCEAFMRRAPWLRGLEYHHAMSRYSHHNKCNLAVGKTPEESIEQHLACSGMQPAPSSCPDALAPVVELEASSTVRFDAQELALLGLPGQHVKSHAHNAPAVSTLFALGPHYLYGRLLISDFFEFDDATVREPTRAVLDAASTTIVGGDSVWVGVHMRHRDPDLVGNEAVGPYVNALKQALRRRPSKRCVVLFAADRRAAAPAFSAAVADAGLHCVIVQSQRGESERDASVQSAQTGEDTGVVAIRDVHLLSHADVLISTFGSTFAILIAELMAASYVHANELRHSVGPRLAEQPRLIMCDEPARSGLCGPELPLIPSRPAQWWHLSLSQWPRAALVTTPRGCLPSTMAADQQCKQPPTKAPATSLAILPAAASLPLWQWYNQVVDKYNYSQPSLRHQDRPSAASRMPSLPTLLAQGQHTEWDLYLADVYGDSLTYPVKLNRFLWFYHHRLPINVRPLSLFHTSPSAYGHAWTEPDMPGKLGFFVQRLEPMHPTSAPLKHGITNHTYIEVMRNHAPHKDENLGVWYWVAPGSGIWLNTRRTYVLDWTNNRQRIAAIIPTLRASGLYDTIQAPVCSYRTVYPMPNNRFELVDLTAIPIQPLSERGIVCCAGQEHRAGWGASVACNCTGVSPVLNCNGRTPPFASRREQATPFSRRAEHAGRTPNGMPKQRRATTRSTSWWGSFG